MKRPPYKPGHKTTEFWMVLVSSLAAGLGAVENLVPPQWSLLVIGVGSACYALSRGIVKRPRRRRRGAAGPAPKTGTAPAGS